MKRALRFFLLTVTVIVLCLSLCSCSYLDELKKQRVVWDENGFNLICNGEVYKPLPSYVAIDTDELEFERVVYLVESDVPLLLTGMYSESRGELDIYQNSRIICILISDEYTFFCHEDDFDAMIRTNPV